MNDAQAPVNDENKKPINRRAVRGKTAALLGNLNESDDDSDVDAGPSASSLIGKPKKAGIYSQKLTQTKLEIKDLHHKFEASIIRSLCLFNFLLLLCWLFKFEFE